MGAAAIRCDCLVVGGGPAGATLAGLLARWGRRVVLADAGRPRHAIPTETMLPGATRVIERCGLEAVFAGPAVSAPPRHGAIWGSDDLLWQTGDPGQRGTCVDRSALDVALRAWARDGGAEVLEGHAVVGPLPTEGTEVTVRGPGSRAVSVRARTLGVAAGRNLRDHLVRLVPMTAGPDTAALCLQGLGDPAFCDATVIEAVPQGWLWWIPRQGEGSCVAGFFDGDELRATGRARLFGDALACAHGPARSLRDTRVTHAVRATPRVQRAEGVLLCGDAASTIDPLASQGIEKALASADAAAVAVNTMLEQPALQERVQAHHAEWERGLWETHAAQAAGFYTREGRFHDRPFWLRRRVESPSPAAVPHRLCVHPDLQRRPALRRSGRLLTDEPGFALPGQPAVGRLGHVPLEPVLRAVGDGGGLDEILERCARERDLVALPRSTVREALLGLVRRGQLRAASSGPDDR